MAKNPETDLYFYHPDHLGSSSWITDSGGHAIQHLQYLPFGETRVDQRTTIWSSRYTFSAKEKDEESGYGYFGARYYDSDISIWLSVDPLASKYPNLSPYAYVANNPVKLVDPNGMEVYIMGEVAAVEATYNQIAEGSSKYGVSVTKNEQGVLGATYNGDDPISVEGQQIMDAINSTEVQVQMHCGDMQTATVDDEAVPMFGGMFAGNRENTDKNKSFSVITDQIVNPYDMKKLDDHYGTTGQGMLHEMTESFIGGKNAIVAGKTDGRPGRKNDYYPTAHNSAIPQPGPMNSYPADSKGRGVWNRPASQVIYHTEDDRRAILKTVKL